MTEARDGSSVQRMRSAIDQEYEGGGIDPDTDRVLVMGYALLWLLEELPEHMLSKQVLMFLDAYLDEAGERALFNLCPRLDYDGKVVPLKRPRDEM